VFQRAPGPPLACVVLLLAAALALEALGGIPLTTGSAGSDENVLHSGLGPIGVAHASQISTGREKAPGGGSVATRVTTPWVGHPESAEALGFQQAHSNDAPPPFYGASIAWDPVSKSLLFFGGLNESSLLPQNETWSYSNGTWTNLTSIAGPAPPARYLASMAWDGEAEEEVLTGGCGVSLCPLDDTWVYAGGAWSNYSADTAASPVVYAATMITWNATSGNGTFLFGGCENPSCSEQTDSAWAFTANLLVCLSAGPCWNQVTTPAPPTPRAGSAVVEVPGSGGVLLYGGFNTTGCVNGACSFVTLNDTWLWNGGTTWSNLTLPSQLYPTHEYPNASRTNGDLFWDPDSGSIFLFGGSSVVPATSTSPPRPSAATFDALWEFNDSATDWINGTSSYQLPPAAPVLAEFAESVDGAPPVMTGGTGASGGVLNSTWVWEEAVVTSLGVNPGTVETNATVTFSGTATQAQATYFGSALTPLLSFGDGSSVSALAAAHSYTRPGAYAPTLSVHDFLGVGNASSSSVNVVLFGIDVTAAPGTADPDAPITFEASSVGGTGPFTYQWSFSDGGTGAGSPVVHAFATAGVGYGNVSVKDGTGSVVRSSVAVVVEPPLAIRPNADPMRTDTGTAVRFSSGASGGTAPLRFVWLFGDGASSPAADPDHTYTSLGTFTVHLWVNDSSTDTTNATVSVHVGSALSVTVSASSTSPLPDKPVTFHATASGGTPPYAYSWVFGDGDSANISTPTHSFGSMGQYQVETWVNDSGGGRYHTTISVNVAATTAPPHTKPLGTDTAVLWYSVAGVGLLALAIGAYVKLRRPPRPTLPPKLPPAVFGRSHAPPPLSPWSPPPRGPPPGAT
jgi:PKD domain